MKQQTENSAPNDLQGLEWVSEWMDNRFCIPGTNLRFGLDAVLGLVPGLGDVAGLAVGGYLVSMMARRGAGPMLMLRMLGNVALDAIVGTVPLFGDFFDLGFKANRRNLELLKKYYASGKKRPSAAWSFALLMLLFFVVMLLIFWAIWRVSAWGFQAIFG